MREGGRFSGARSGDNQQGIAAMGDRLPLLRIQRGQKFEIIVGAVGRQGSLWKNEAAAILVNRLNYHRQPRLGGRRLCVGNRTSPAAAVDGGGPAGQIAPMEPVVITDLNDSRLDVFRSLRTTNASRRADVFIAEGTTLVERVLHSDFDVECVLGSEQKLRNFKSRIPADTIVYQMPRELASQLVGYSFHNGVLVAARRRPSPDLANVLPATAASLVLVGDQIIDEQNLGLLIRIGSAFGASAVIAGDGSADAFSRRVLRVSMGNGLVTPVISRRDSVACLRQLQDAGYTIYGAVLEEGAMELAQCQFAARSVIVVGNETHGICDAVRQQCDALITISMHNQTDSLNVAIASGIFLHAYRSQHAVAS